VRRAALLAVLLGTAAAGEASAHAELERAQPPVGATVAAAPAEVSLWFTEQVEPAFSGVEVRDAGGRRVDKGDARLSPGDPKRLTVGLGPIGPGTYKVLWHVVSVDTHRTVGDFTFRLAP
jgi:methionine-rich copper-binding protein CopC